ncbi:MAG: hypothetical protein PHQ75_00505 [Thermoguttaceae bacterium]|nr:hypothetical protein [Thermoguttaceae bacterium]
MNLHYNRLEPIWDFVRDAYLGTPAVKFGQHSFAYLPPSASEKEELEAKLDNSEYAFRKKYATFENLFRPAVNDIVGILQKNTAKVAFGIKDNNESPPEVSAIDVYGNAYNDGLIGLKQRLNFNQVLYGRYGLLLDVIADSNGLNPQFKITEYTPQKILDGNIKTGFNGKSCLDWVLLDESTRVFNKVSKQWMTETRYRVLGLDANGDFYHAVLDGSNAVGDWSRFDFNNPNGKVVYPIFKQKRLDFIPFTVCNVSRLGINEYEDPPFSDVADITMGVYQIDSLYKKALWNFASPTLVVSNAKKPEDKSIKLGNMLWFQSQSGLPVSASLMETNGSGLSELRNAKAEMKQALRNTSIRELLDGAGANSSGDALQLRTASGTAMIATIDQTGARAIEEQLIYASMWAGATFEEAGERISYKADTSYLSSDFQLQSVVSLLSVNAMADGGMPLLSKANLYAILEKSLPNTLTSFEDNESQKVNIE